MPLHEQIQYSDKYTDEKFEYRYKLTLFFFSK